MNEIGGEGWMGCVWWWGVEVEQNGFVGHEYEGLLIVCGKVYLQGGNAMDNNSG